MSSTTDAQHPTRVYLRLDVRDFTENGYNWMDYVDAVKAYYIWTGLSNSLEDQHCVRAQPEPIQEHQKRFFVIVDLYYESHKSLAVDDVRHELYAVKRGPNSQLTVKPGKDPNYVENYIKKIREVTDKRYPWGSEQAVC